MKTVAEKDYTPNAARSREQSKLIAQEIAEFEKRGGKITQVPDFESAHYKPTVIDQTANIKKSEMARARKRGLMKMGKGEPA